MLYTTYLDLPTNAWYNSWIKPFNAGPYDPASVNSEIARKMEDCASPGFYFEVTPTQGISEAMNALFQQGRRRRPHQQLSTASLRCSLSGAMRCDGELTVSIACA